MNPIRTRRVSAALDHSNRLSNHASFYGAKLDMLRKAWYADEDNAEREARYKRLSARFHRESNRLIRAADELISEMRRPVPVLDPNAPWPFPGRDGKPLF
jgi:hypothetical protein